MHVTLELLPREDDSAENCDEDQDGGDFEGQQQRGEELVRDLGEVETVLVSR